MDIRPHGSNPWHAPRQDSITIRVWKVFAYANSQVLVCLWHQVKNSLPGIWRIAIQPGRYVLQLEAHFCLQCVNALRPMFSIWNQPGRVISIITNLYVTPGYVILSITSESKSPALTRSLSFITQVFHHCQELTSAVSIHWFCRTAKVDNYVATYVPNQAQNWTGTRPIKFPAETNCMRRWGYKNMHITVNSDGFARQCAPTDDWNARCVFPCSSAHLKT